MEQPQEDEVISEVSPLEEEEEEEEDRKEGVDSDLPTMEDFICQKEVPPDEQTSDPVFENEVMRAIKLIKESRRSTVSVHAQRAPEFVIVNHSNEAGTVSLGNVSSAFTGASSRFGDVEAFINTLQMEEIRRVVQKDEIVRASMQLLVDNVVGGGLSPTMDYWGSIIRLSDMMQRMFDIEWVQRFLRDMIWSLFMYGFVVARLVQSNVLPTEAVPQVIDPSLYEISTVRSFDKPVEYRVYPLRFDTVTGEIARMGDRPTKERKRVANAVYEGDESVSVYVFPGNEPTADGEINSPLMTIVDKLKKLEHYFEDASAASYWAARPSYPINSMPDKSSGSKDHDPMKGYNPPEAVLGLTAGAPQRLKEKKEEDRTEVETAINAALNLVEINADDDEKRGLGGRHGPNPYSKAPPMRNFFSPGLTHQVGSGPTPVFNTMLPEMCLIVSNLVAGVLKIPAQMVNPGQQVHAANAELNMRLWDIAISGVQRMIEPIVSDLFAKSYRGRIKDNTMRFSKEVAEKWAEKGSMTENDDARGPVDGAQSLDDTMRKHIKSTGAPTNTVSNHKEAASAKMKRQMTPLKEKLGKRLGTKEITFDNVRKLMEEHVTFNITFKRTPMLTFDAVWELYERDIIDWEELTKLAAEIFHIDPAHILNVKQRDAQQQEKRKFQSKMDEAYGPSEEKPGASGSASKGEKPKSKAVAQPAAGKKKQKTEKSKSGGSTGKSAVASK